LGYLQRLATTIDANRGICLSHPTFPFYCYPSYSVPGFQGKGFLSSLCFLYNDHFFKRKRPLAYVGFAAVCLHAFVSDVVFLVDANHSRSLVATRGTWILQNGRTPCSRFVEAARAGPLDAPVLGADLGEPAPGGRRFRSIFDLLGGKETPKCSYLRGKGGVWGKKKIGLRSHSSGIPVTSPKGFFNHGVGRCGEGGKEDGLPGRRACFCRSGRLHGGNEKAFNPETSRRRR